jgi:hypothetical protein
MHPTAVEHNIALIIFIIINILPNQGIDIDVLSEIVYGKRSEGVSLAAKHCYAGVADLRHDFQLRP